MRIITSVLFVALSFNLSMSQECAVFSKDSVEYTKQLNDIFFSPSGHRGIAIGKFSYDLLFKKDSVYWEKVTNNFGVYADADMKSGLFINENYAVAVDLEGYIHTILDMGDDISWGRNKFDGNKPLYDIDFYEDSLGIAVGLEGSVLRAIDFNGLNFGTIPAFTTNDLYAVDIVNDSIVYIAGNNTVFKSTDFGDNWNEITPEEGYKFIEIKFFNPSDGVAISEGGYSFVTANGGESWTDVSQYSDFVRNLAIYNDSIIYACGGMDVLVSYNKGYYWYRIPGLSELGRSYKSIDIKDSETLALAEHDGTITTYKIGNNIPPSDITLSDTLFYESGFDSLWVADISVYDPYDYLESIVVDNSVDFFVENYSLKNTFDISYSGVDFLDNKKITLAAIDSCGFKFQKEFTITVLPYGPTDISLSSTDVIENKPIGRYIGKFATDAHVQSNFTYELVPGNNDVDNNSFYLSNDSLFTKEIFQIGTYNSRQIRIKSVDDRGNSFQEAFFLSIVAGTTITPVISEKKSIIFPNPVANFIYFEGDSFKTFEIINLSGTIEMNGLIETNCLHVESLQSGVYILRLTNSYNNIVMFLFLKE
jgi:photosystem II stability/assembly factor-like uncharacterized protein